MSPPVAVRVCAAFALLGLAGSSPAPQRRDDGGSVLWSVLADCLDTDEPAAVCLKSRALSALDRALGKSTVAIADGVTLSARAGKSVRADPPAWEADRDALDAAKDADHKNALLDDMLVDRMDELASTRTFVLDGSSMTGQEGRGKKKEKALHQAVMMAILVAAAILGPLAMKTVAVVASKALLIGKISLILSTLILLKKTVHPSSSGHETETVSHHHYGRNIDLANGMAYSAQQQ